MNRLHQELLKDFQVFGQNAPKVADGAYRLSTAREMTKYNWVGFYLVDPADPGILLVGSFVGNFTPNARIPLDKGLCGAAAKSGQVVVVHDVHTDSRYLSGSAMVKSEIVVPIIAKKMLVAELDIESYFVSTFTKAEQEFVEACAGLVGKYLASA